MRGVSKDMNDLFKRAKAQGWTVHRRNNNHYLIEGPDGQKVFCGGTPSDHRAIKNIESDLSRAGLDLKQ